HSLHVSPSRPASPLTLPTFPTRRSSDLLRGCRQLAARLARLGLDVLRFDYYGTGDSAGQGEDATLHTCIEDVVRATEELASSPRSEEHTSELQSRFDLVCRLLLEKKKSI